MKNYSITLRKACFKLELTTAWRSLVEGDEKSVSTRCCVYENPQRIMQHMNGNIPNSLTIGPIRLFISYLRAPWSNKCFLLAWDNNFAAIFVNWIRSWFLSWTVNYFSTCHGKSQLDHLLELNCMA